MMFTVSHKPCKELLNLSFVSLEKPEKCGYEGTPGKIIIFKPRRLFSLSFEKYWGGFRFSRFYLSDSQFQLLIKIVWRDL